MMSPTLQRAALNQHGGDRTAAAIELGFDHGAFGGTFRIGLEIEQFGLQRDHLEQLVEIGLVLGGYLDVDDFAAERFDLNLVLQQFGAHALRLGVGLVDLVDRHDHRNLRRLGVVDRLDRLRHDAVIGRHHQDHDIGDLGAARAHRGERGVAGRIDEGDLLAAFRRGHLIGADMLGDAAGFARNHVGVAKRVEQRGLAVVDMAHHGDDRRARLGIGGIVDDVEQALFDVGRGDALDGVAHFLGDQLRGVGIDHVGDLVHRALLHQQADDVDRALRHAVGEFLDRDRFRDRHLADQLFLRLVRGVSLQALGAAAERGDRTLAHVVGVERGDQRQAAAFLLRARLVGGLGGRRRGAWRRRGRGGSGADLHPRRNRRRQRPGRARAAPQQPDGLPAGRAAAGGSRSSGRRRRRGLGLGLAKSLLGLDFGLALGFLFQPVPFFLGLAAGFGGLAFGLFDAFTAGAALGFFLGQPPFLDFAHLGVGQRAGAGGTLVFRQRAQHHAGTAARRARRCRGAGEGGLGGRRLGDDRLGRMRFGRGRVAADAALATLFDHDLLGPAMAEALAHGARLDPRLQRQGLGRDTQSLVARRFGINHSAVLISLRCAHPHSH